MRRGSTPTNTFNVNLDLTAATVFVTYAQGGHNLLEKTGNSLTVTATSVVTRLTQEDTLKFQNGSVEIQIRYVMPDGSADASNIIRVPVDRILKDGVIEYAV